jgi:hypothetical protein
MDDTATKEDLTDPLYVLQPAISILEDALADLEFRRIALLDTINLIRRRLAAEEQGNG